MPGLLSRPVYNELLGDWQDNNLGLLSLANRRRDQFMDYKPTGAPSSVGGMAQFGLSVIPGIGDALALAEAKREYEQGNTGMAAFNAATALPVIGDAALAAKIGLPMTGVVGATAKNTVRTDFMDMPLYHGMAGDIEGGGFSLDFGGDVSRSPVGSLGVSVALDPETAAEFANLAAKTKKGKYGEAIVPLLHRAENPTSLELAGNESNLEMAATIQDAWDKGFDSIMIKNYTTPSGRKGVNFILVKDPSQLRSPHAKFDPSKKHSKDILAGTAGAGVVYGASQKETSEPR